MKNKNLTLLILIASILLLTLACGSSDIGTVENAKNTNTPTETISITPTSELLKPTLTITPAITSTPSPIGNAIVTVNFANLRSGPGTTFEVVASSKFNDLLPVFGKDKDSQWVLIDLKDGIWISTMIVNLDIDINSILIYDDEMNVIKPEEIIDNNSTNDESSDFDNSKNENSNIFNNQIELLPYSTYSSFINDLIIYGEVKNISENILKDIYITITLKDKDGNLLDFDSSFVYTPWELNLWETGVLYPNAIAPFMISFEDPGDWVELIPSLKFKKAQSYHYSNHYKELTIINDFGRSTDVLLHNYQITGEIENSGDLSCSDVWLVVTLYDDQGNVVGFEDSRTDFDILNPGEIKSFKIELYARGEVDHYNFYYYAIKK